MARLKTETRVIHNAGPSRHIGQTPSRKNRDAAVWESLIERDYFLTLEHNPRVVRYVPQPEKIKITLDPRWKSYTPDVLVFYDDGSLCRVEVKSDKAMCNPEIVARLEVVSAQYRLAGKDFRVVTDSDIRVGACIPNLRALHHYTRFPLDAASVAATRLVLTSNPGIGLNAAAGLITQQAIKQPLPVIFHLMFRQHVEFDLYGAPISSETKLYWGQR